MSLTIQSNINQGLSLLSLVASQTPLAATQREKAAHKAAVKLKEQEVVAAYDEITPGSTEEEVFAEAYGEALGKETAAKKQLFEKEPTTARAKEYITARTTEKDYREAEEEYAAEKAEKASARAAKRAENALKEEQKRIAQSNRIAAILEGTPAHTTKLITEAKETKYGKK